MEEGWRGQGGGLGAACPIPAHAWSVGAQGSVSAALSQAALRLFQGTERPNPGSAPSAISIIIFNVEIA